MARVLVLGAGGHAAVVVDAIQAMAGAGSIAIVGLVAIPPFPDAVLGFPVIADERNLSDIVRRTGADSFVVGVGTLKGGKDLRSKLFEEAKTVGLKPFTVIHPSAIVSQSVRIGAGATIMAGVIIQPRTSIGANAIINTRASIDHDCVVGDHTHIAPGAVLSGDVAVGAFSHVGTGASVLNGIRIGHSATVGAGAAVIADVPDGTVVFGVPARAKI